MLSVHSSPAGDVGTHDTGGMSVYISELSRELGSMGHGVDLFTCRRRGRGHDVRILAPGVRLVSLDLGGVFPKEELFPRLPRFFRVWESFARSEGRRYDVVHSHYWLSGCVGSMARERWKVPHVITFHTLSALKLLNGFREAGHELRLAHERRLVRRCDGVVAATVREKGQLESHYRASPRKVGVVPCGVDLEGFRPENRPEARIRLGLDPGDTLLLYVGRFDPLKGLHRLLEALPGLLGRHPSLRLLLVGGDGPDASSTLELRRLARDLGVAERVAFAGRVAREKLPPYYGAADALVLPSRYESFGLVALESLACGTPVVATRVGAMEDLILPGKTGMLADGFDVASLARALDAFLESPEKDRWPAERIRRSVSSLAWSATAAAMLDQYRKAASPASELAGDSGRGLRKAADFG